jgi:hypothetical protein
MERDYGIFEHFADGSLIWRETVSGHEDAIRRLRELAEKTINEVRAMHIPEPTYCLIAARNGPKPCLLMEGLKKSFQYNERSPEC